MRDLEQLGNSTETSVEILQAIREIVGDDEKAIMAEWQDPRDADAIISRARALSEDDDLFWGAQGAV